MTRRPKPAEDDGPSPYRQTPRRLSRQIRDRSVELADLAIRIRELAAFVPPGPLDVAVNELLQLSKSLSAHSIAVLVGRVEITPSLAVDGYEPERPILDRIEAAPLERRADEIAPAIAARPADGPGFVRSCRVCGCTDDDCRHCIELTGAPCHWVDDDLCSACVHDTAVRPPPEHPAAGAARTAAKRRMAAKSPRIAQDASAPGRPTDGAAKSKRRTPGQGRPVDPSEWTDGGKHAELAEGVKKALESTIGRNGRKGGGR